MRSFNQRKAWEEVAAHYQREFAVDAPLIHYGPLAPTEAELGLLGNVAGLRILEIGCGGGQSCIAFAQQGASVTGLDLSDAQLHAARQHAKQAGVAVQFVRGSASNLAEFAEAEWDMIFSTLTFHYLAEPMRCLHECHRLLRTRGRLIFSVDHPLRNCFFDAEENETSLYPVRSYFDHAPMRWRFPGADTLMESYHYTIGEWVALIRTSGMHIERLVEPPPPAAVADATWPDDGPLMPMRKIPHTLIVVAHR
ncbi:MAG: methyltransferase domain-containing protein [Caldilineaceae bacterium]|nr:methyltransferase domain-containing protein [Caldilineaceae bacterium]